MTREHLVGMVMGVAALGGVLGVIVVFEAGGPIAGLSAIFSILAFAALATEVG